MLLSCVWVKSQEKERLNADKHNCISKYFIIRVNMAHLFRADCGGHFLHLLVGPRMFITCWNKFSRKRPAWKVLEINLVFGSSSTWRQRPVCSPEVAPASRM